MKTVTSLILALAVSATSTPAVAQEKSARRSSTPDWRLYLTTGLSYTQRDDADEPKTHYYRIPLSARLTKGPFRVTASMPFRFVDGPGGSLGDEDGPGDEIDKGLTGESRRGFGDLSITGRYRIPDEQLGGFELDHADEYLAKPFSTTEVVVRLLHLCTSSTDGAVPPLQVVPELPAAL